MSLVYKMQYISVCILTFKYQVLLLYIKFYIGYLNVVIKKETVELFYLLVKL